MHQLRATSHAEVCDASALDGETCLSQGLDGGTLGCNDDCSGFDESSYTDCGDGVIEGNEQCDFNNLGGEICQSQGFPGGGTLQCTLGCVLNQNMSGQWTLTSTDSVAGDSGTLTQWCLTIAWQ